MIPHNAAYQSTRDRAINVVSCQGSISMDLPYYSRSILGDIEVVLKSAKLLDLPFLNRIVLLLSLVEVFLSLRHAEVAKMMKVMLVSSAAISEIHRWSLGSS